MSDCETGASVEAALRKQLMDDIARIADEFGVSVAAIMSPVRDLSTVRARQKAMWMVREATLWSSPEIGQFFGGYDHTSVLHNIRQYKIHAGIPVAEVVQGKSRVWNAEKDAKLLELRKKGLKWREIGAALGVTSGASEARFSKLGGSPYAVRKWTNREIERLIEMARRGLSTGEISNTLGWSRDAVRKKRTALRLDAPKSRFNDLTETDLPRITKLREAGAHWAEIGRLLGVSKKRVRNFYVSWVNNIPPPEPTEPVVDHAEVHILYLEACAEELGVTTDKAMKREYAARCEREEQVSSVPVRVSMPSYAERHSMVGSQFH